MSDPQGASAGVRSPQTIIASVIGKEGGYVDHPADRGGPTKWGITEHVARANGYKGPMRDMPRSVAETIYLKRYVQAPRFDRVAAISPPIAAELVDTGVNMGPEVATGFLQRALNGLNRGATDYADLVVDRQCGPATRGALSAYLKKRGAEGERRLLRALDALQGERYLAICEARPSQEAFLFGWLDRLS